MSLNVFKHPLSAYPFSFMYPKCNTNVDTLLVKRFWEVFAHGEDSYKSARVNMLMEPFHEKTNIVDCA